MKDMELRFKGKKPTQRQSKQRKPEMEEFCVWLCVPVSMCVYISV